MKTGVSAAWLVVPDSHHISGDCGAREGQPEAFISELVHRETDSLLTFLTLIYFLECTYLAWVTQQVNQIELMGISR